MPLKAAKVEQKLTWESQLGSAFHPNAIWDRDTEKVNGSDQGDMMSNRADKRVFCYLLWFPCPLCLGLKSFLFQIVKKYNCDKKHGFFFTQLTNI